MAGEAEATRAAPRPPEPAYELEWETRAAPKRSRLSRLFLPASVSTLDGVAPDPEAAATVAAPPRPQSFQRKPLPPSVPPPVGASTGDDNLQQAAAAKEARNPTHSVVGDEPRAANRQAINPSLGSSSSGHYAPADAFKPSPRSPVARSSTRARLGALLPPNRKYLGLRRRAFLTLVGAGLLVLLALVIGLAAGLSAASRNRNGNGSSANLLPDRDGGRTHEGDLTFYDPGLGACGGSHGGGDMIAAVAHSLFDAAAATGDANPNNNPLCGRRIGVSRGGESVEVTVVDRCQGCQPTDLDLSPAAFQKLAREQEGRVVGQWKWL